MKEELLGVRTFGVLFILFGAGSLLLAVVQFVRHVDWAWFGLAVGLPGFLSLYSIVMGIGVLTLEHWARWMVLIGYGIAALLWMYSLAGGNVWLASGKLGWSGFVLWYFLRPSVKAQFSKAATSDPSTSLGAGK